METQFSIQGMTCGACRKKVSELLMGIDGVDAVDVQPDKKMALISSQREITEKEVAGSLKNHPQYRVGAKLMPMGVIAKKPGWQTYKPVFLIGIYLTVIGTLLELRAPSFSVLRWMNHFMAGFFLIFSFFKLLNLTGFAASYAMYDVVAGKWKPWGYIYPFVELLLGLAFLSGTEPVLSNWIAFIVMAVSLAGVLQSVFNKRKIKCACLGDVFNLPMSTVTIIEDSLMMVMSGIMIATHLLQ